MLINQLKTARRNLVKNKGYAFINILGLAIGLSLCFTIYLVTNFELGFDSFHPGKERIYRMVTDLQQANGEVSYQTMVPDPMAPAIQKELAGVETIARFHNFYAKVLVPGEAGTKIFDAPKEKESPSTTILAGPSISIFFITNGSRAMPVAWGSHNMSCWLQARPKNILATGPTAK